MLDLRMEAKKLNAGGKIAGYCADRSLLNLKRIREIFWSGRPDLNRRPPAPKAGALPGCATPRRMSAHHIIATMTDLLLASQNPGKLAEMRKLVAGLPFHVVGPRDIGIDEAPDATGTTFL